MKKLLRKLRHLKTTSSHEEPSFHSRVSRTDVSACVLYDSSWPTKSFDDYLETRWLQEEKNQAPQHVVGADGTANIPIGRVVAQITAASEVRSETLQRTHVM